MIQHTDEATESEDMCYAHEEDKENYIRIAYYKSDEEYEDMHCDFDQDNECLTEEEHIGDSDGRHNNGNYDHDIVKDERELLGLLSLLMLNEDDIEDEHW